MMYEEFDDLVGDITSQMNEQMFKNPNTKTIEIDKYTVTKVIRLLNQAKYEMMTARDEATWRY